MKPCCESQFAIPEVAISTGNLQPPALGTGLISKCGRLEHWPEYLIQHLSVLSPLLSEPHLRNIAVLV